MTNNICNPITEVETIDGIEFTFILSALVDYTPVDDGLYEPEDLKEIYKNLDNYTWMYFCAELKAYVNGINLSTDTLGQCIYESLDDFKINSGYYEDMKSNCVKEALEVINEFKNIKV